jgi:hypothetical protein
VGRATRLMSSRFLRSGDRPPCMHRICSTTTEPQHHSCISTVAPAHGPTQATCTGSAGKRPHQHTQSHQHTDLTLVAWQTECAVHTMADATEKTQNGVPP